MINFNLLTFSHVIMHRVHEKIAGQLHSNVSFSEHLITISQEVEDVIKKRLIDAAGRESRSFELKIENVSDGSFFDLSKSIIETNNENFIEKSKTIAELLGESQTHHRIPGGYLILISAIDNDNKPLIIVIKAEPHEALKVSSNEQLLIENVFLSPSQKLYKIGVLHQDNSGLSLTADLFKSYLFDDQFRQDGHPAEYFYKSFLGLNVSENSKIQTNQFYIKTEEFIKQNIELTSEKMLQFTHLKSYIGNNTETIRPLDFANNYMISSLRDSYIASVVRELPNSFVKDSILIKSRISQRKISFGGSLKIIGPEYSFNDKVKIFQDIDELSHLDIADDEYSILLIKGLPFEDD